MKSRRLSFVLIPTLALLTVLLFTPFPSAHAQTASLDVDQNGVAEANTDGQIILRFLFGLRGPVLVAGILGNGAQQTNPDDIVSFLETNRLTMLDADCSGQALAQTDGNLIIRFLAGLTGNNLTTGVTDSTGCRPTAAEIIPFLNQFLPGSDSIPPTLKIISPATGTFVTQKRPLINLQYGDDESGINTDSLASTLNSTSLQMTCTTNETTAQCTPESDFPEGEVTLEVSIEDQAGNTQTTQSQFTVDTTPIDISITAPADGLITTEEQIDVSGTVGAGVSSVTVNGIGATVLGTDFSATIPLREGKNMIVAVAEKGNGNTGTDSIDVTRDNVAPIVRIDTPRDGFVSVVNRITITGQVNDIVNGGTDPQVSVNGRPATVANGTFVLLDLQLVNGPNTIEAVATDAVGNVGRHMITIRFTNPVGARVSLLSGNGQSSFINQQLAEPLVAQVTDEFGSPVAGRIVTFQVTRNNGTLRSNANGTQARVLRVPTNGSGQASVLFTLGSTAGEGNNRVKVTGQGVAGEVEFCATGQGAQPDKIFSEMGDNQRGLVNQPLATPLETLVVDSQGNAVANVDVTFMVVAGGGNLNGQQTLERQTGTDGIARAVLTLGPSPGINNNLVEATFAGLSTLPASYVASALAAGDPAETTFRGVVLDNGQTPIPGAVVSIEGSSVSDITDDQGQFLLTNVPVGHILLHIDPSNSPRLETFPPLEFETVTVAGQENILGQAILLPAIPTQDAKIVGGDEDVTLTMSGIEGLSLTVFANSVTFPDGSKTGLVSISQVHMDKVPMAPPEGGLFVPPAWTIQPSGVAFDPPAKVTIPNNGSPPGDIIDIFQFDHALNQFVNIGKGTVSEDGTVITSDSGFGITHAGWGGGGGGPVIPIFDIVGDFLPPRTQDDVPPVINDPNNPNGDGTTPVVPGGEGQPNGGEEGGDPVILYTGEFILTETDLQIPGRGFDFEFKRTYRSQYNFNGPLGFNWDHNYRERLDLPDPGDTNQDILRCSGRSRLDRYVANPDGSYTSPTRFYDTLTKNPDGTYTIRNRDGFKTNFDDRGFLANMVDRNGNTMTFIHNDEGKLLIVTDTMGRDINFAYGEQGHLISMTDFLGREVRYRIDGNGHLAAVRSPVVLNTVNGNNFPNGKTTRYEYTFGFDASEDPRLEFLNHNMTAITDPKGQRYLVNTYGQDPDSYEFDRLIRQQEGTADQVYTFDYRELNPGGSTAPNMPRNQTITIDRNGNRIVSIHNSMGNVLERRVETNRNINPLDPQAFITIHTYNADGERTSTTFPEGNRLEFTYDESNPNRFQQGNLIQTVHVPGPRAGDQTQLTTTQQFEPIFNQLASITEPRGNDPSFVPPNGGATSAARYTTTFRFDYQEGNSLSALAAELGLPEGDVSTLLANAGISLNIGDQNDDGLTNQANGNVVRREAPTVNLLAGSQQAGIEGDSTQEIVATFTHNRFGQLNSETDPEGNVDDHEYYPETDPDGDGTDSISTRTLATDTGGYRKATMFDNRGSPVDAKRHRPHKSAMNGSTTPWETSFEPSMAEAMLRTMTSII